MFARTIRFSVLLLVLAAPAARADSLGEAVNLALSPDDAAALANLPPDFLRALHASSSLLAARGPGLLDDRSAAARLAEGLSDLAEAQATLLGVSDRAFRVAVVLQGRVAVRGARELLDTLPDGASRSLLLGAAARHSRAFGDVLDQRLDAGGEGPDNPCFQNYGACMEYCAELDDFVTRSLCGMDCNIDFGVCLGGALRRGGRDLLGGLIEVAAPARGE